MAKTVIVAAVAAVLTVVLLTALDLMTLPERMAAGLVILCAAIATSAIGKLVDRSATGRTADADIDVDQPARPLRDMHLHTLRSQVSEVRQEVSEHARRRTVLQYAPRLLAEAGRLQHEVDALQARWHHAQTTSPADRETSMVYDGQLRLLREELNALLAEITGHIPAGEGHR